MRTVDVKVEAYARHATVNICKVYRLNWSTLGCSIMVLLIRLRVPLSAQVPRATLPALPVVLAAVNATCLQLQHVPPITALRFASEAATRRRVYGGLA